MKSTTNGRHRRSLGPLWTKDGRQPGTRSKSGLNVLEAFELRKKSAVENENFDMMKDSQRSIEKRTSVASDDDRKPREDR
jgi:hypothetical protein